MVFQPHQVVFTFCVVFVVLSVSMAVYLIYNHLRHFTEPRFQKPIVRILLMVPIYSVDSLMSLALPDWAFVFDVFRDCYEAYVIYEFFVLLVQFCDGEDNLIEILNDKPPQEHPWPFCFLPKFSMGRRFYILCKRCVLQFVIVKPLLAFVEVILELCGVFHDGSFSPKYGYLYVTIIDNTSITIALYFLVVFYMPIADELKPFRVIPKFLCIKTVIFFAFWQGVLVAFLVWVGAIKADEDWTVQNFSAYIQDSLICVEMFIISFGHAYAFGYSQFKDAEVEPLLTEISRDPVGFVKPVLKNLSETLSVKDVVNDTVDVFGRELTREDDGTSARREGVNPHKIPKPGGSREEGYAFTNNQGGYGAT